MIKKEFKRNFVRKKFCRFCKDKINSLDYKDVSVLQSFMTDRGKIVPSRITGTCAKHQRMLAEAVKKSRYMALVPYSGKTR